MFTIPSISCLHSGPDRMIEKILESGTAIEIEYKGKKFLIDVTEKNEPKKGRLENILQHSPISPISDISYLVSDFWPEEESADDFIDYTYQQRKKDAV